MHHLIVTRVSLTLTLSLAAAVVGFALLASRPAHPPAPAAAPVPAAGEALFAEHCGRCHDAGEVARAVRAPPGDGGTWSRFLREHVRATPEQDRAILDYLKEQP